VFTTNYIVWKFEQEMGLLDIFKRNRNDIHDAVLNTPSVQPVNTGLLFGNLFQNGNSLTLSAVYRCVELISDSVAILPIDIETKDGKYLPNHQLYQVFDNRDNLLDKYTFIKMLIQSVLLKGNGFAYINRHQDGSVKSLRFLESGDVSINYNKETGKLLYSVPLISKKQIEPINMVHLKKFSYDGINGISVLSFASNSVKNSKNTEQSASDFFSNGRNLAGILKVNSPLTPQQTKDIKKAWSETYTNNGQGIAVLQGNMDFQPISVSSADAQMIESRHFNVTDICRWFGINPVILGEEGGSQYGVVESLQREFVLHTLLPYVKMIEEEFNRKLLKLSEINDINIKFDIEFLLKANKKEEAEYLVALSNNGLLTPNECRLQLGYQPIEGGDQLHIAFSDVNQNTINNTEDE
jgi:HK97 family phage portal protein